MKTFKDALTLHQQGKFEKAESVYLSLLRKGRSEDLLYHLGVLCYQQGKHLVARNYLVESLRFSENSSRTHSALALCLESLGEFSVALEHARRACELAPGNEKYWNNLGKVKLSSGDVVAAIKALDEALRIKPDYLDARYNRGLAYGRAEKHGEAINDFLAVIDQVPSMFQAHLAVAAIYSDLGEGGNAAVHLKAAVRLVLATSSAPKTLEPVLIELSNLIDVPIVYTSVEHQIATRSAIESCLENVERHLLTLSTDDLSRGEPIFLIIFFRLSNFYWAYQGYNDREVNERYVAIMRKFLPSFVSLETRQNRRRPTLTKTTNICVISEYFGLHATTWIGEILKRITLPDVKITYLVVNDWKNPVYVDELKQFASVEFLRCDEKTFSSVCSSICKRNFDLIIYPDVGMTATSRVMSAFRLAKFQLVHWAHPVTTGSPSIDYFLSGKEMEPSDFQAHYSERVISLPGIGLYLSSPQNFKSATNRALTETFNIATIQSLFKYSPAHDWIYVEIVKRIPSVMFHFIEHPYFGVTHEFRDRIFAHMRSAGLDPERHVKIRPRMSRDELLTFLAESDLYLDSFEWSGGNTTLDALEAGCPIYTVPGKFMRGRHTYGILTELSLCEGLCADFENLFSKLKAAQENPKILLDYRRSIEERRSALYEQESVVSGFRELLLQLQTDAR